jgi:heat shock protein HslJ
VAEALAGTRWVPTAVTVGGEKRTVPADTTAWLTVDATGRASGSFGCNGFGGRAVSQGEALTVSDLEITATACVDSGLQETENALASVFRGKLATAVSGADAERTLTLTAEDGGSIAFTETEAEAEADAGKPATPLAGTRWSVTTISDGDSSSSSMANSADGDGGPFLALTDSGDVNGNLGCNPFNGKATTDTAKSTITFGALNTTRRMCDTGTMKTENLLKGILTGKVSYTVKGDVLTLTGASGKGLTARAAVE